MGLDARYPGWHGAPHGIPLPPSVRDACSLRYPAPGPCPSPVQGIPLLVLGNKNDLPGALGVAQLTDMMNLQVGCSGRHSRPQGVACEGRRSDALYLTHTGRATNGAKDRA